MWRVLNRFGLSRLRALDPPNGRVIRRYEKAVAGELVHVDIKKFGQIPDGGGWRAHGRGNVSRPKRVEYTSRIFADTLESVGVDHVTTRPFRPQTNGKVERFQRTLATTWTSDKLRGEALNDWVHQYNHHRYHTAINGTPISRVNNLRDQYN